MGDGYEWYFNAPKDYTTLQTKKRKRCRSCDTLIDLGAVCSVFYRYRPPNSDIEEDIHGDEVQLANGYFCEKCSDLYFSLTELGYCVDLDGLSIKESLEEYLQLESGS